MTSPPPIVPGPGDPAPPPQVVYVQAPAPSGQQSAAVTKGVLDAFGWVIVAVMAVCLGIPALLCLVGLFVGGVGKIFGG